MEDIPCSECIWKSEDGCTNWDCEPVSRAEARKKFRKPKTNADRIRTMTDEELAYFIASDYYVPHCPNTGCNDDDGEGCEVCWLHWLKKECGECPS